MSNQHSDGDQELRMMTNRPRQSLVISESADESDDFDMTSDEIDNTISNQEEKNYPCTECDRVFSRINGLKRHMRQTHMSNIEEETYQCTECIKVFSRLGDFTNHMRTHTGEKPYQCSQCGKAFSQSGALKTHYRTHTGEQLRPFSCSQCEKRFESRNHLIQHENAHNGVRPHQCMHCEKSFSWKNLLTDHIRTHTGERPYECSQCGKTFSKNSSLISHRKIHTGEKPHQCTNCDKAFIEKSHLKRHLRRVHNKEIPYQGNLSGKVFTQNSTLLNTQNSTLVNTQNSTVVKHRTLHTEEKPYNLKYSNNTMKAHTGEKSSSLDSVVANNYNWHQNINADLEKVEIIAQARSCTEVLYQYMSQIGSVNCLEIQKNLYKFCELSKAGVQFDLVPKETSIDKSLFGKYNSGHFGWNQ